MTTHFVAAIVEDEDSFKAGKEAAKKAISKHKDLHPKLAILFCTPRYDYASVIRGIQNIIGEEIPLIGCTTAGQFTHNGMNKEGVACALLAFDNYHVFSGIGSQLKNNPIEAIQNATITFPKQIEDYSYLSSILFIDGLTGKGEETVLAAMDFLGPNVKLAGAAAADHLAFKETVVFNNQESLTDAVSICLIASRSPIVIAVQHGHHPISPPLCITKAKENILFKLDGRPALGVWKEILHGRLLSQGIDVEDLNLSDWSKIFMRYEAGFLTGSGYNLRFPISCNEDGSLNFTCPIVEGSYIKIMDSEPKDQIESTRIAVKRALQSIPKGTHVAGAIIFDSACRSVILKEQWFKLVETYQQELGSIPFIGCETYGEIAMENGQLSGFHNGSIVIMLLPS